METLERYNDLVIEALLQEFDSTIEVKFDDSRQRLMAVWGTLCRIILEV